MADITAEQFKEAARKAAAAGDTATARSLIAKAQAAEASATGIIDQAGSGANEGLASFLGFPVDMATKAINAMEAPVDVNIPLDGSQGTMTERPPLIQDPVGGSGTFRDILSPLISDAQPQTTAQRYARRIGQEVGFGGPASLAFAGAPVMGLAARESMPAFAAASTAGDVGAGVAGQTAREYSPDNAILDIVASMAGGAGGAGAVSMLMPKYGKLPTLEGTKQDAADAWGRVNASDARLSDAAVADLDAAVKRSLPTSQVAPRAYPNAFGMADDVSLLKNPKVSEVEDVRRIIGDAVAGNAQESRVGVAMKKEIADYLAGLKPKDFAVGDGTDVIDDLATARDLTSRVKRAEAIANKEMRGESRAATSGTGGNVVNAQRQNIRSLYDIERDPTLTARRKGFKPEEMRQMDDIVFGTGGVNTARLLGRLSPTSGALPLMAMGGGGVSGATASMLTGNPIFALPMAGAGVGMVAKGAAEQMTKGQIKKLIATILAGEAPKEAAGKSAAKAAILEQLMTSGAN